MTAIPTTSKYFPNKNSVFVGGLKNSIHKLTLKAHLSQFGTVIDTLIPIKDGRSLGFAIVTFSEPESVSRAISQGFLYIEGREVTFTSYLEGKDLQHYQKNLKKRRICLKNVPKKISKDTLEKTFSKIGPIQFFYLKNSQKNMNIGFVAFKNASSAKKAIRIKFMKTGIKNFLIEICEYKNRKVLVNASSTENVKNTLLKAIEPKLPKLLDFIDPYFNYVESKMARDVKFKKKQKSPFGVFDDELEDFGENCDEVKPTENRWILMRSLLSVFCHNSSNLRINQHRVKNYLNLK